MKKLAAVLRSRKGQGTVEYALITLAVVAIVIAVLFSNAGLSQAIRTAFTNAATQITGVNAGQVTGGGGAGGGGGAAGGA